MITPVNNHLLIEPLKHQTFLQGEKETFEEVGIVIATEISERIRKVKDDLTNSLKREPIIEEIASEMGVNVDEIISPLEIGDKVYFDSWLASKYPKNETEWYWLVSWQDVRAIEHHEENPISE